jgi:hypothetical protein
VVGRTAPAPATPAPASKNVATEIEVFMGGLRETKRPYGLDGAAAASGNLSSARCSRAGFWYHVPPVGVGAVLENPWRRLSKRNVKKVFGE